MSLCQLFIQPEAAFQSVAELGEIGIAQFRDVSQISVVISHVIHLSEKSMKTDIIRFSLSQEKKMK